jgi:hypothetical protein
MWSFVSGCVFIFIKGRIYSKALSFWQIQSFQNLYQEFYIVFIKIKWCDIVYLFIFGLLRYVSLIYASQISSAWISQSPSVIDALCDALSDNYSRFHCRNNVINLSIAFIAENIFYHLLKQVMKNFFPSAIKVALKFIIR